MKNKTDQDRANAVQNLADDPDIAKEIEARMGEGLQPKKTKLEDKVDAKTAAVEEVAEEPLDF